MLVLLTVALLAAIIAPLLWDLWRHEKEVWHYARPVLAKIVLGLFVMSLGGEAVAETGPQYSNRQAAALVATAKSRREALCPHLIGGTPVRMACWVDFSWLIIRIREMPRLSEQSRRDGEFTALLYDLNGLTEHYKGNPI